MLRTKLYARNQIGTGLYVCFPGDRVHHPWIHPIFTATSQTLMVKALHSALEYFRVRSQQSTDNETIIAGLLNLLDYVGAKTPRDKRQWRTKIVAIDCTVGHDLP